MNYAEIINAVLLDLNETTIAESAAGLSGTRGIQTTVKEDVNRAIRDINNEHNQWPYNYELVKYNLFGGRAEYKFPTKIKVSSVSGAFTMNERITGGTSGAIGIVRKISPLFLIVEVEDGIFQSSETLTGASSSATATSGNILDCTDIDFDTAFIVGRNLITNGSFDKTFTLSDYWNSRSTNPAGTSTSGTPALSNASSGNLSYAAGVLRLNAGTVDQAIPTVVNDTYRVTIRFSSGTSSATSVTLRVFAGSSSDKDSDLSESFSISNVGGGKIQTTTFTASTQQTFITLSNEASANVDVDFIEVFPNDISGEYLYFLDKDEYYRGSRNYTSKRERAYRALSAPDSGYGKPEEISTTNFDAFLLCPSPDNDFYSIELGVFFEPEPLSAFSDIPIIPKRFHDVIVARAKYFVHQLIGNDNAAQFSMRDYELGVRRMRSELIQKKNYMRAV